MPDKDGTKDPDPDHFCQCTQGVLRWRTKKGKLILARYPSNPFKGQVKTTTKTQDEQDWEDWLEGERDRRGNEFFNPVEVVDL